MFNIFVDIRQTSEQQEKQKWKLWTSKPYLVLFIKMNIILLSSPSRETLKCFILLMIKFSLSIPNNWFFRKYRILNEEQGSNEWTWFHKKEQKCII